MHPRITLTLGILLQWALVAAAESATVGHCRFDSTTDSFKGNSLDQAGCLLRHVAKYGNVSSTPTVLPPEIKDLIGKPTGGPSIKIDLRNFIRTAGLSEADLGGSLNKPLSRGNNGDLRAPTASYFVIHDTSSPYLGNAQSFPPNGAPSLNQLSQYAGANAVAHVFVNRLGATLTGHDFQVPWRATKLETKLIGKRSKGLFLHVELLQPRRRDPAGGPKNDAIAPVPGFTDAQYERLALLYAAASVRGGTWLIPAFHASLDEGIKGAHDDPQHFDLDAFSREVGRIAAAIGPTGTTTGGGTGTSSGNHRSSGGASANATAAGACAALISALPALASGPALQVGNTSSSWKALYDQCDASDTFAGNSLPSHNGRRLRCSTDPNRVAFINRFPDNTVVFKAKMSVDADGSPVIGGSGWPNNVQTWLTFDTGSKTNFVNAEEVPFVVVPVKVPVKVQGTSLSFQRDTGIGKGDLAVVQWGKHCSFGVVGDAGPWYRIGEASLRTHEDLDNPQCAHPGPPPCKKLRGGSGVGIGEDVTYVIFPGTRPAPLLSQTVNDVAEREAAQRLADFLESLGP